jgi:hypothetical protein
MGYVSLNEQYVLIDTLKPHEYLLQSLETKETLTLTIVELASDLGVLYRLSPLTACYLGREYADYLKNKTAGFANKCQTLRQDPIDQSRHLSVRYQLRSGDICYINHVLCEEHTLSADVLAAQPHLIQHFNAKDAFFIGASSVCSPSRM